MANLTEKQLRIVDFVQAYRRRRRLSPTLEEIATRFGVSKITVLDHIRQLEKKGVIRRQRYRARSIELVAGEVPPPTALRFPLCGVIQAGAPLEAVEDREALDLSDVFPVGRDLFVLRVRGDSMIGEQIRDGDFVICENRPDARNGATVVALLEDGSATLKKIYRERGGYRLQPANEEMEPIRVKKVEVRGVVIGVIRRYA